MRTVFEGSFYKAPSGRMVWMQRGTKRRQDELLVSADGIFFYYAIIHAIEPGYGIWGLFHHFTDVAFELVEPCTGLAGRLVFRNNVIQFCNESYIRHSRPRQFKIVEGPGDEECSYYVAKMHKDSV